VADDDELGEVRQRRFGPRLQICATATMRSTSGLTGTLLQRPWVKRTVGLGNCRLGELVPNEIGEGEGLNQRHSSPSPRITRLGFLPFSSAIDQGVVLGALGGYGGGVGTEWG
jgi:hypothetical protein